MWDTSLKHEFFVFESPSWNGQPGLQMTAKRYTAPFSEPEGLTLLFAHGINAHKEHWEPTLQRLFYNQRTEPKDRRIREAWSLDWPNHGDAAELNKERLRRRPPGDVCVLIAFICKLIDSHEIAAAEWGFAIASFVRTSKVRGHRLVAFGHSAGAGAIVLSTRDFSPAKMPYIAVFLVEPCMITRSLWTKHLEERNLTVQKSAQSALRRRHMWDTVEEAAQYLRKRRPWNVYHPKVFDSDQKQRHGFRTQPFLQDAGVLTKVVLKCDSYHEALAYQDVESHFQATEQYTRVCHFLPVHVVFGSRHDYVPSYFQECMTNTSEGRVPASVVTVPGAGHVIVQESPDALADAICIGLNMVEHMIQPIPLPRL
ncbi:Alpha/beta hydrolase fold-1 [Phlebopus sp. FC_14]|nr:Alpha/beta hydrolase fold-1 [Phlebopus sp. FC_14]